MLSRGDAPDLTVDELLENDESDEYSLSEEDFEEFTETGDKMARGVEAVTAIAVLHRMFANGYITAAEFDERTEDIIEYAENEDSVDMP